MTKPLGNLISSVLFHPTDFHPETKANSVSRAGKADSLLMGSGRVTLKKSMWDWKYFCGQLWKI